MTSSTRRSWPGADIPGRRLFVAVPLPDDAVEAIAQLVASVRADGVPGGGRDVRWVRLDGLHLTLRFLGPTPPERVEPTQAAVMEAAVGIEPFELTIEGAGAFPSAHRPRALWLGVGDGKERLAAAAAVVDRALEPVGWPPDPRPFRAHLTLARSDGVSAGPAIAARLTAAAADLRLPVAVERIGLFESLTGGGPARYEPLEIAALE